MVNRKEATNQLHTMSSSLASLLLQGSSNDSCHQDNNPLNSLTKTFERQPHGDHRFPTTQANLTTAPTNDQLILRQQLAQEQQKPRTITQDLNRIDHQRKNWSTAFLRTVPFHSFLPPQHSSSTDPQWQSEFTQSHHSPNLNHQKLSQPQTAPQNIIPSSSLLAPSAFSQLNRFTPHHYPYHPLQSTHLTTQGPPVQHSNSTVVPALDWDSAFLKYDHHVPAKTFAGSIQAQTEEQSQINGESTYLARSHSPINSTSPDALAQTAASLIATVESGQHAQNSIKTTDHQRLLSNNTNENSTVDKFTQSSFMEFMRQLRDGEVKVEGDKVVQQIAPVRGSSSTINYDTQMNDFHNVHPQPQTASMSINNYPQNLQPFGISEDLNSEPKILTQPTGQLGSSVSQLPSTDQALAAYRKNVESGIQEINQLMEETDAELEHAQYQAMMNSFQGDGGGISESNNVMNGELDDILNAASEVGRPEKQTWTNTATHVPGATESWTEEFDQPHHTSSTTAASAAVGEQEDFDEMGMFGRPIYPREFELERLKRLQQVPSAQQQEWERLQSDWEKMANDLEGLTVEDSGTSTSTISPATFLERIQTLKSETGYNFQQANPQLFLRADQTSRSMHHSSHQPWEQLARDPAVISPLESVLQKEKDVLSQPELATAWYELGVKQQENEREEMAIQALQQAIKLDPELSDAILALAISYSNENRREEALEEIERWIAVETSRVPKYRQAAPRQSAAQNSVDDMAAPDEPSKLRAKHAKLTSQLIDLARLGGRIPESASVDPDVQIALGVLFNSNDEFEKACDCFGTALAVRPDDPLLFNRLGATLANSGKPEEAIEYYTKAIELLPSYIRARYNLSISLINLGRYLESIKNLFDSLIIQEEASSSSALTFPPPGLNESHGPLHRLSGNEKDRSGVTSDVLWQTLEINCSLVKHQFRHSENDLERCFLNKDLDELKLLLHRFL